MKNAVIYGSTNTGMQIYDEIYKEVKVVAFIDEDSEKWGGKAWCRNLFTREITKYKI